MRPAALPLLAAALAVAVPAFGAAAHEGHPPAPGAAAGPSFPVPPAGSYRLPPIRPAAGGVVLDETGRRLDLLRDALRGRATVLALIYTRCGDLCPLASADMARLQDLAAADADLSRRMRLVTLSFDPEHDTPEVMRAFAAAWRSSDPAAPAWAFLTAPDRDALAPILAAYDQRLDRRPGGALGHLLRAFLIDRRGRIRNIYSLDFFEPALVLNDVRTLLLEEAGPGGADGTAPAEARSGQGPQPARQ
ncbi:electron transport protein SCO1/SenC [Methylobacterium sp. 4-46]|uniref:SCO family protein n=1 Tax=unclassified Methylobacterium TaxID=2615210 RepID=UPI000152E5F3|nr:MULTISPECIES: SCO family protein [Methylobacterium]ACA15653.1 electron transport protein SCO1/SenC [Methylobacterium sp. 4-46]WFT81364.1 SCO family protein [Methylobacterium nodulans]WFT81412.1 SCO family protein [Methylobacterium nodulans]